ncbi:unnamed protein product [Effrenium voratum]|uniref:Uncharacterized protein n=1 Tax=Effrenium voratum TaxID=2562239 RepID=A0AA36JA05_9DINO|nr:unnamed protein product [Effrenium voratum]
MTARTLQLKLAAVMQQQVYQDYTALANYAAPDRLAVHVPLAHKVNYVLQLSLRLGLRLPSQKTMGTMTALLMYVPGMTELDPQAARNMCVHRKTRWKAALAAAVQLPQLLTRLPDAPADLDAAVLEAAGLQGHTVTEAWATAVSALATRVPLRKSHSSVRRAFSPTLPVSHGAQQGNVASMAVQLLQQALRGMQGGPQPCNLQFTERRSAGGALAQQLGDLFGGSSGSADREVVQQQASPQLALPAPGLPSAPEPQEAARPQAQQQQPLPQQQEPKEAPEENTDDVVNAVQRLRVGMAMKRPAARMDSPARAPAAPKAQAKAKAPAKPKAKALQVKPKAKSEAKPKAKAQAKPKAKPAARRPVRVKYSKTPPKTLRHKFQAGCGRCRYALGCTPSCWRLRGY